MITHTIDVGDTEPVKAPPYQLNPEAKVALEKHIDAMLENNIIEESAKSPWTSPVLVRKPNNVDTVNSIQQRLQITYRQLGPDHHEVKRSKLEIASR